MASGGLTLDLSDGAARFGTSKGTWIPTQAAIFPLPLPFAFLFVSSKESLFQDSYSKITVVSRTKSRLVYVEGKTKKKKENIVREIFV